MQILVSNRKPWIYFMFVHYLTVALEKIKQKTNNRLKTILDLLNPYV